MAIIRIIFIIVLVFYLVRFLDRHVVPFFFGKPEKKKKSSPPKGGKEFHKKTNQGEVTITDFGSKKKEVKPRDDDFVDFEEVE
jgi:hypothetical protein